jgi:hypothetical protein
MCTNGDFSITNERKHTKQTIGSFIAWISTEYSYISLLFKQISLFLPIFAPVNLLLRFSLKVSHTSLWKYSGVSPDIIQNSYGILKRTANTYWEQNDWFSKFSSSFDFSNKYPKGGNCLVRCSKAWRTNVNLKSASWSL